MSRPAAPHRVWIGWDPWQKFAWTVAAASLRRRATQAVEVRRVDMGDLRRLGLYTRPTSRRAAGYWDDISAAPMSTGHAIARFLVPLLAGHLGWALFTDGDVLFRTDIAALFALADPSKAVQVVQHAHAPAAAVKMEGHAQTAYARKNWSSVMLFNAGHPANRALTVDLVNAAPGRDLHRFCWLTDDLVGALPATWNVLIGEETDPDPAIAHFTLGVPNMPGYEAQPFADEWRAVAASASVGARA